MRTKTEITFGLRFRYAGMMRSDTQNWIRKRRLQNKNHFNFTQILQH